MLREKVAAIFLAGTMIIGAAACAAPGDRTSVAQSAGAADTKIVETVSPASGGVDSLKGGELTQAEREDLLHMREEEKLARDVYLTLYDKWGQRVFENISSAEQTHMDAVGKLLQEYGIEDPVAQTKDEVGKFVSPELQKLYNDLVEQGSKSLESALTVGATIEDLDIKDLDEALSRTDKADIKSVYENLKHGSENHMRAFVSNLNRLGSDYTPKYITPEEYNEIIHGTTGGNGRGMRRRGVGIASSHKGGGRGR